jgi:hypothetical protein
MIKYVLAAAILWAPAISHAQQAGHMHSPDMKHGVLGVTMGKSHAIRPKEPGQSAFATIQEIVSILDADPNTDWSKVDIEALRRHLIDMNNVTMRAWATASPIKNGIRYLVAGTGPVRESIRRMVVAHAKTMSGVNGMTIVAENHAEGATMTVTVANPADLPKLKGLGFIGIMTVGMHHQEHHLMIAAGRAPHH